MSVIKNNDYIIQITGMTADASGVGRVDNFAIFVPMSAIGDVVRVKVIKVLKSYAFGKIIEVITSSTDRIAVDCECYHQCGGCEYRHISYEAELAIKQDIVANAFLRLGGITTPCDEIIGSQRVNAYRNKAQYPVGIRNDSDIISGFYARRSHRIISCDVCLLQPELFAMIKGAILDFIVQTKVSIYNEINHNGLIRHIYIRQAEVTGEIMVCIVATSKTIPKSAQLVEQLTKQFNDIKSIVVNVNNADTNVILGAENHTIFGKNAITDSLCGITVNISPLSFYQVNKLQAEVLYNKSLTLANLTKDDILIDLYCGTGTIGLIAAKQVEQVIGVEIVEQAIIDAIENARVNGIDNCQFICADAKKASQKLLTNGITPTVIIVDPPRKGLDSEVIEAISAMNPNRVVMVSCNPATAARDTKSMVEQGYMVEKIVPVDMFPRTGHVETCVLLSHKNL